MKNKNSVRPEDILPDGIDSVAIDGKQVRKGTIAAFLQNTEILEDPTTSKEKKQEAIATMKELALAVIAIGLHKHVIFKNPQAEQILLDASLCSK